MKELIMKETIKKVSTEYNSWRGMKERCTNPKHKEYKYYGGRGIAICSEWSNSSKAFIIDMGPKPSSKHSIDRIDPDGNYCKDNCRWADHFEQQRNKRNSIKLSKSDVKNIRSVPRKKANGRGDGYTRQDIADMFGLSKATTVRVLLGVHYLCET